MTAPASAPGSQSWSRRRRRGWHPDPQLRVSDAERASVADRLSKHYGEGRLDQAEFDERLDRAMKAKTHGDLSGLLADLPGDEPPAQGRQQHRSIARILFLGLLILVTAAIGEALAHSMFPWLLIAVVLALLWLRFGPRRGHRDPD